MKAPGRADAVVGPGDAVVQHQPAHPQPVPDGPEVRGVVAHPDVLGQPDGGDGVEAGLGHVAVVAEPHLGEVAEALPLDGGLGPRRLLARQRDADDPHPAPRGIPDHPTPAAADVEEPVALREAQLVEHEAVLVLLGLLQGRALVRVAGAGVGHRGAEDVLVEGVGHVVVVADRLGVTGLRVAQPLGQPPPPWQGLLGRRGRRGQVRSGGRPGRACGGQARRRHRTSPMAARTG